LTPLQQQEEATESSKPGETKQIVCCNHQVDYGFVKGIEKSTATIICLMSSFSLIRKTPHTLTHTHTNTQLCSSHANREVGGGAKGKKSVLKNLLMGCLKYHKLIANSILKKV
jgi:hypothetical protein